HLRLSGITNFSINFIDNTDSLFQGIYWAITALDLMHKLDVLNKEDVITFVLSCLCEGGGFAGHPNHDPHLLYTLSGIQILATYDALDRINIMATVQCEAH